MRGYRDAARRFSAVLVGSVWETRDFWTKAFNSLSVEVNVMKTEEQLFSQLETGHAPDFLFLDGDLVQGKETCLERISDRILITSKCMAVLVDVPDEEAMEQYFDKGVNVLIQRSCQAREFKSILRKMIAYHELYTVSSMDPKLFMFNF